MGIGGTLRWSTATTLLLLSSAALGGWNGMDDGGVIEEAMTLKPDLKNGKEIYNNRCIFCHTEKGWGIANGIGRHGVRGYPQLARQHRYVLIKQLTDISQRNRDTPAMYIFSRPEYLGGAQEIANVTAYIETLPMTDNNGRGPGHDLERGEDIYKKKCAECHGPSGEGSNRDLYPRLQGQHYEYMLRQLIWIRDGKRRNANSMLMENLQELDYRDLRAVSDYVSRIPLPKALTDPLPWGNDHIQ